MKYLFKLIVLISVNSYSQNLVVNPSFENVSNKECGVLGSSKLFEKLVFGWSAPTDARPELLSLTFNENCLNYITEGFIRPHDGNNMVLFCNLSIDSDFRSYVQVKLKQPLEFNEVYKLRIWIHTYKWIEYGSNNIGVHFSDSIIYLPTVKQLHLQPHINFSEVIIDTTKWICLESEVRAPSEAKYMLIGNFKDNSETKILKISDMENSDKAVFYLLDSIYLGTK